MHSASFGVVFYMFVCLFVCLFFCFGNFDCCISGMSAVTNDFEDVTLEGLIYFYAR